MYADRGSFGRYGGGRSPYAAYANRDPTGHSLSDHIDYLDERYNVIEQPTFEDEEAPDTLHLHIRGETYTYEFAPFSIAEEKATVRDLREKVAREYKVDPGCVKLMYKDHELKRNDAPLKKYGCKQNSEISVILMQESRNYNRRDASDSESYAAKDDNRRPRSYSTNRPRDAREPGQIRTTYTATNGYLGATPTTSSPRVSSPARTTRAPSPTTTARPKAIQKPTADPSTNLGKIQAIAYEYHTQWEPMIAEFIRNPPQDKDERTKEYRKLGEIAYKKVFDAGDAIELDGPQKEDIRATRKQLYAEVHADLKDLDRFKPKE